jgi:hypothetical protein
LLLLMLQTLLLMLLFPVPSLMLEKVFETQESLLWLGTGNGHYYCMRSRHGHESGKVGEGLGGCSRRIKTEPQHSSLRLDRIAGELASSYKLAKNSGSALVDTQTSEADAIAFECVGEDGGCD